jgi:uncharacterized protein YxeA
MKKFLICVGLIVLLLVSGMVGYNIGTKNEKSVEHQTFYAKIESVDGDDFFVSGLQVNDYNFRGDFTFRVTDETQIEWRYTEIQSNDLYVGSTISITFSGEIEESSPAHINRIHRIQLLDDEL